MLNIRKILIPLAAAMLVACAGHHQRPVTVLPNGEPPYNNAAIESSYYTQQLTMLLKDSLKAIETTDWLRFRREFLKCRLSQPNRFNVSGLETVIKLARKSGDSAEELKVSKELLDIDFTNISAHYTFVTSPSTDENVKEFHKQIIGALLRSIRDSGKGYSTGTAMYVINIGEEYDFIYLNGFKPVRQALVQENGRYYDHMITEGNDGKKYQFYFDVTDFFGHY